MARSHCRTLEKQAFVAAACPSWWEDGWLKEEAEVKLKVRKCPPEGD